VLVEASQANGGQQTLTLLQSAPKIDFTDGHTSVAEGEAELETDAELILGVSVLLQMELKVPDLDTLVRSVLVSRLVGHEFEKSVGRKCYWVKERACSLGKDLYNQRISILYRLESSSNYCSTFQNR
jgi:hypothetical protein